MNVRQAVFLLCSLLIVVLGAQDGFAQSATSSMEKALKSRSKGDYESAIRDLKEAISQAKKPAQKTLAQFMLGDCLMELKKPAEARSVFEEILSGKCQGDEEAEAWFRIAQCHALSGNQEKMKSICSDLMAKYPETPYAELAKYLSKSGRVKMFATTPVQAQEPVEPDEAPVSGKPKVAPAPSPSTEKPETKKADTAGKPAKAAAKTDKDPLKAIRIEPGSGRVATTEPGKKTTADSEEVKPPQSAKIQAARETLPALPGEGSQTPESQPEPKAKSSTKTKVELPKKEAPEGDPATVVAQPLSSGEEEPAPKAVTNSGTEPAPAAKTGGAPADLLAFKPLSSVAKEALATEILKAQSQLPQTPDADQDEILFRLASQTTQFGELLEGCKLYDQLLTRFPSSKVVEEAYFEAIRLRAILKAYGAVVSWGDAFLKTFPQSRFRNDITRLIEFSRPLSKKKDSGKTMLNKEAGDKREAKAAKSSSGASSGQKTEARLLGDPEYREAKRLMTTGKYGMAHFGFQKLSERFSSSPIIWWELALVQVQLQKHGEAEKSLQTLLNLDPHNDEARSLLGYVHFQKKDYKQAADEYHQTKGSSRGGLEFFNSEMAARRLEKDSRPISKNQGE